MGKRILRSEGRSPKIKNTTSATATKQKIEAACKALKPLGISKTKVKAKLKELLELYDNKWELIEDENYHVLLEAILAKTDETLVGVQSKNKASFSLIAEASEPSSKKICRRYQTREASSMQHLNTSLVNVSSEDKEMDVVEHSSDSQSPSEPEEFEPPLTRTQHRQEKEVATSPNSHKRVASTSFRKAHQIKAESPSRSESASESEDFETPLKRSRTKCQIKQVSTFMDNSKSQLAIALLRKVPLDEVEFSQNCEEGIAELTQWPVGEEQTNFKPVLPSEYAVQKCRKVDLSPKLPLLGMKEPSQQCIEYKNFKPTILPLTDPKEKEGTSLVCYANPDVDRCLNLAPSENVLDLYHNSFLDDQLEDEVPITVIHPDLPLLLCGDASSDKNNANPDDLKSMDKKSVDVEDKSDSFLNSQFDVASSPEGEVKLYLICNTSQQSDFCVPSFKEVVKVVEDECRNSYGIKEPNFSLLKLMRELCERFLAMGAVPSNGEHSVPSVQKIPSKEYDASEFLGIKGACQLDLPIPPASLNGSVKFQNLIEVIPQISKHLALSGLDCLHYMIGFKIQDIENICVVITDKKLEVLKGSNSESCSRESGQKHQLFLEGVKPYAYLDDISRGEERVKISFVKGSSVQDLPAFAYIPQNVVYDKASVKCALSCISDVDCCSRCTDDCLSLAIPCACAQETGTEFAYTSMGLLKPKFLNECISLHEDPKDVRHFYCINCPLERYKKNASSSCKGHLLRKFIKECWSRCGCSKKCGNRVVQRGITRDLQVFWTLEGKGWGLQTVESLPRGAFVCEYVGEILTNSEMCERNIQSTNNQKNMHPVSLDAAWCTENVLKDEEALCLDATNYGNIARFINHRCSDANLIGIPVEVEITKRHYYHLAFFTKWEVAAMEELTWDYGIDFNDINHPEKAFKCLCGSPFCRDQNH